MLAVAAQFQPKEASEAFRMFISWGVRFIITSNTSRGSIDEVLAEAAHLVYMGEITTAVGIRKQVSETIPVDEEFRKAFETASVSKAQFARYYLRSLEMAAKGESAPWFVPNDDQTVINLEHILPESPEKNWPHFNDDEVRIYSRKIGNLALLKSVTNSDLHNSNFAVKKAAYAGSPYVLTSMIAKYKAWTKNEIASRQTALAYLALKAWPL
jgi:hypothetical protein